MFAKAVVFFSYAEIAWLGWDLLWCIFEFLIKVVFKRKWIWGRWVLQTRFIFEIKIRKCFSKRVKVLCETGCVFRCASRELSSGRFSTSINAFWSEVFWGRISAGLRAFCYQKIWQMKWKDYPRIRHVRRFWKIWAFFCFVIEYLPPTTPLTTSDSNRTRFHSIFEQSFKQS